MRGPSGFSVAGLGELGRVTNESRLKHDPIRSPGAWFACSVLEPNSEIGDGAFRDLGRGAMLYILRAGRMTASSTRTHRTGSDSTRIQIRPSGKCDSNRKVLWNDMIVSGAGAEVPAAHQAVPTAPHGVWHGYRAVETPTPAHSCRRARPNHRRTVPAATGHPDLPCTINCSKMA